MFWNFVSFIFDFENHTNELIPGPFLWCDSMANSRFAFFLGGGVGVLAVLLSLLVFL